MKAMILAAGRGERMRPLTDTIPKPLVSYRGQRLIEPLLRSLSVSGIKEVVMNVCYLADFIMEYLQDGRRYGLNIVYSREKELGGLETGGGVLQALPLLGPEPFLIVSADVVSEFSFGSLLNRPLLGLAHLVFVENPDFNPNGDFNLQPDGGVSAQGNHMLTYANIGILHPKLFEHCVPEKFPLVKVFREAIAKGQMTGELFRGQWCNIGTIEQLK